MVSRYSNIYISVKELSSLQEDQKELYEVFTTVLHSSEIFRTVLRFLICSKIVLESNFYPTSALAILLRYNRNV